MADLDTDTLYHGMRIRHGGKRAGANGYQSRYFFLRERQTVLGLVRKDLQPIVDVACGSGLMVLPMQGAGMALSGLDFNLQACRDAAANGLPVIRGDAFCLPFADNSLGQLINCQFLNQQSKTNSERFVGEASRVLRGGGRLILAWRNGTSWLHRGAAHVIHRIEMARGLPRFPQYIHTLDAIKAHAKAVNLRVLSETVTTPLPWLSQVRTTSRLSTILGASFLLVMEKNDKNQPIIGGSS